MSYFSLPAVKPPVLIPVIEVMLKDAANSCYREEERSREI